MREVRSARHARAGQGTSAARAGQGVGARQGDLFAPPGGGGYLDECNPAELSQGDLESAKIRELEDMGMQAVWLRVARAIGYENYLELWRILDAATAVDEMRLSDNGSMIEVQLRRYASFQRYQRNRFIEGMASAGMTNDAIQAAVSGQLGENLTRNHIVRLARPFRRRIGG